MFINLFSIQKIQRGKIFLLELTGFVVAVLDTKIQRGRIFFTRTDTVASSLFFLLQILSRSCFIVDVLDTKNSKRQNFLLELTGLVKERTE